MRIGGTIHRLRLPDHRGKGAFGIIVGDDGHHYFFLPSDLLPPLRLEHLQDDMSVMFEMYQHARGMRAKLITVSGVSVAAQHG